MAKRNASDKITIQIPDVYEGGEAAARSTSAGTRSARAQAGAQTDPILQALVEEHNMSVEKSYVLNRRQDYSKRSAGARPEDTKVQVAVEKKPDEQVVMLVEEDGVYRWEFAKPEPASRRSVRGADEPEVQVFEIDLAGYNYETAERRGIADKVKSLAKKVKAHVISFRESASVSNLTIKRLERKVSQCVLNLKVEGGDTRLDAWEPLQSLTSLALPQDRPARVLLFIHGTFSSTAGSYGGLCEIPEGRAFLKKAIETYDVVLGFDHHTLSETPTENAWEILKILKTARWPEEHPPVFDAIGYSRGGLVLRSLIERELPDDAWDATFRRAIFVGATNAGTELAKPENWYRFIDFYTNLAAASTRVVSFISGGGLAGPVFAGMIRGLGAFAKYLATSSVTKAKIPGLAAMEPGGAFVTEINRTQAHQPGPQEIEYFAITSDFDASSLKEGPGPGLPKRLLLSFGDGLVDQLMGDEPNDLVVHTASMTQIDPHVEGLIKQVRAYGTNGQVYHTVYFIQPETARALYEWLELPGELEVDEHLDLTSKRGRVMINEEEEVRYEPISIARQDRLRQPKMTKPARQRSRPGLKISVHWDDITRAEGDAFAVGHYRGVDPQSAELAVDHHVSQLSWGIPWEERRKKLVLTSLTKQGLLVGDIGQIDLFPWGDGSHRVAAICGMGFFNGDFSEQNLQLLYRKLVWKLNTIPRINTLCTVLIGSGVGSLDTRRALRGQLNGYADAMAAFPDRENRIREVKIVEYDKLKAQEILDDLKDICRLNEIELDLDIDDEVQSQGTGRVSEAYTLSLLIGSMLRASQQGEGTKRRELLEAYVAGSGIRGMKKKDILDGLKNTWAQLEFSAEEKAWAQETAADPNCEAKELEKRIKKVTRELLTEGGLSRTISVRLASGVERKDAIPNRLSIRLQDDVYRIAGLTASSAVPEREIKVDVELVHELIERMTDPDAQKVMRHGKVLYQLLIPGEFEELLTACSSLVFEVDRDTAPIHWEMLILPNREQAGAVSLTLPVSRQLRTTYSNMPSARFDREKRALVIGNPDGTLEFAEDEALVVSQLLQRHGFEVDTFIGAPNDPDSGIEGYPTANRLDVLEKLFEGKYTIVHYAGHGDYDPEDPSKTGWLFTSGLLTAGEFSRLKDAPALIFANACLSSRTSLATVHTGGPVQYLSRNFGEAGLLPGLADEVLRLGVRNYIGTAWEVDDKGAILFAERFYENFLADNTIGESVYEARKKLSRHAQYGALWAAYQHYGPPEFMLSSP